MCRNIEITVNFERGPPYINAHAQKNICIAKAGSDKTWTQFWTLDWTGEFLLKLQIFFLSHSEHLSSL